MEKTLEIPLDCKEILFLNSQEISPDYSLEGLMLKLNSDSLVTWCEKLTHWKRLWCWERLKLGGEGDDRGWDGWILSVTRWTWVWAGSGTWWWTGRPGVLQSMGSQRVDTTEQVNRTEYLYRWENKIQWKKHIAGLQEHIEVMWHILNGQK